MTKRMNLQGAAFLLTLTMFLAGAVFAQNQSPQFKVGDRVETDTLYSSMNPEKSMFWGKGTIVKMDNPEEHFGSYTIKLDKDSQLMTVRFIDTQWIRPLKETNAGETGNCMGGGGVVAGNVKERTSGVPGRPCLSLRL